MPRESGEEETQTTLLTKEGTYSLHDYKNEAELEKFVVENSEQIFGSNSIYFDIKKMITSKVKKRVTDGLLLDLNNPDSPKFWIVENELSVHDPYRDIAPQVRGFLRALREEETLSEICKTIYGVVRKKKKMRDMIRKRAKEGETYYFIDKVLHKRRGIIIVIDKRTPQLDEVMEELSASQDVRVIEFRTYKKGGKFIHGFTPLARVEVREEALEHYRSWEARLRWAHPLARSLVNEITAKIEEEFPKVAHAPKHRWYYFFASKEMKPASTFLVLLLRKKRIEVRIITASGFNDPKGITKKLAGWFFPSKRGQERRFYVSSKDDLEHALPLIRQAYKKVAS